MPVTKVVSRWVGGNLVFYDADGNIIATWDGVNRRLTVPTGSAIDHGGVRQFVDVSLSAAQVLALNATPVQLVAAPGANLALVFEKAVLHKPAGTAYAAIAAGDDLAIKYTDANGIDVAVAEMTGFADQTTAQTRVILAQTGALAAGTVSDFTPVANAALVAHMLTGEITTGDSPFRFRIWYHVVPTVLS